MDKMIAIIFVAVILVLTTITVTVVFGSSFQDSQDDLTQIQDQNCRSQIESAETESQYETLGEMCGPDAVTYAEETGNEDAFCSAVPELCNSNN